MPASEDHQKQCFSASKPTSTSMSYLGCNNSTALYHNLVFRSLYHLSFSQGIILIHYIDFFMFIGASEQAVETTLRHLCVRIGNKSDYNTGAFYSVKFIGIQWCEEFKNIPSKVKNKLFNTALSMTQKRGILPRGPLWILEAIYSSFGYVT